jgi:Replication-relaxation
MTGINSDKRHRMIVQPRDLHLLRELSLMRVVEREQAKIVGGFGSTTRANTRLLALTRAGLLRRFFLGSGGGRKALYALSPKGALVADVPVRGPRRPQDALLVADYFVSHRLAVNEIYCTLKYRTIPVPGVAFRRWLGFHQPVVPEVSLIPDGYVELTTSAGNIPCFLEVDLGHESLAMWKGKAQHYLQLALSGKFQQRFEQERFRVLVVVNSERRLHSIRKAVAAITQKLFWFATLETARDGFFAPVWFRPAETQPTSLFETTP